MATKSFIDRCRNAVQAASDEGVDDLSVQTASELILLLAIAADELEEMLLNKKDQPK